MKYDDYYPKTRHDTWRICVKCRREYRQWSRLQDNEPWTWCEPCARIEGQDKKKKK